MKAGRIVLIVLGSILILTSFGLLIGGGVLTTMERSFKDQQGYYSTHQFELSSDSAAIVSGPANIDIDDGWVFPNNLATIKIEAVNVNPDQPVFIGIARSSSVNKYLAGVSYSETRDLEAYHNGIALHTFRGADSAPAPTSQNIWVASANGSGTQTLEWEVNSGRYSVVLMNADGSSPVDADVSVGVKIPEVIKAVGVGLLVGGFILLMGGGVMLFFGIRGW
jgi:hypothetical protein